MTKTQVQIAMNHAMDSNINLDHADLSVFDGYGLPSFQPVYVTIDQVARLIRWQCMEFGGTVDGEQLDNLVTVGRRKFQVI